MSARGGISIPMEKVTLNLFAGDFDALGKLFPENHRSQTLRNILRRVIEQEAERKGISFPHLKTKPQSEAFPTGNEAEF